MECLLMALVGSVYQWPYLCLLCGSSLLSVPCVQPKQTEIKDTRSSSNTVVIMGLVY